ncbi:MAG: ribosome maturation factor RimM [Lachnospiraceae bacterium]|nr:ribosome maturation factor RimM [Lachnospiraceae bacterium]
MEHLLQVGILSSTHGIHGEMKVFPTTDDMRRFKKLKTVLLDTGTGKIELKIEGVKFFKQFVILKFEGYDSINDIEKYKGRSIYVTRENAVKLKEDEYYMADLIGMTVYDDNDNKLGEICDILQTGANDVYVISSEEYNEILLPAIKQCVLEVDVAGNRMRVHLPEGLLDL